MFLHNRRLCLTKSIDRLFDVSNTKDVIFATEFRNNGFMKEAVNLLSKFLFEEVKLNKIMAQTGSFNDESNYLLKSCGFKLDGCLREHHELDGILYDDNIYSILKSKDGKRKNL